MYLLAENRMDIKASSSDVFEYIVDLNNFGDWFPEVAAIKSVDDKPIADIGKKYIETVHMPFGGQRKVVIRLKECRPGSFFATEGNLKPLLPRMEVELQPNGEGTRITWRMYSRGRGPFLRLVVLPPARLVMKRRSRQALENLKAFFESKQLVHETKESLAPKV